MNTGSVLNTEIKPERNFKTKHSVQIIFSSDLFKTDLVHTARQILV